MRIINDLSAGWLFSKLCKEAPTVMPEGAEWEKVTIPHTWNAVDGHDGSPFDRGAYWYVTSFVPAKQPLPGGRYYIEVGAASLYAEIWVNGVCVGKHTGGYSAFRADVTDACIDGENVLAILCDNRYSDKYYPQRADFTFYGGLYRHVKLISVAESRFTLDDFGGSGVYVDTEPSENGASIRVRTLIDNVKERQTVSLQILDGEGKTVAESWNFAEEETVLNAWIPNAKLWDGPESAYLYTAKLSLITYNEVLDEQVITFGVRSFVIDKEKGFYLNGKPHPLRGVCRHQDRLYIGNALSRKGHFEDAQIIADMGANCIRLAHYQQSHDIYDACDQLGLVVWAEIPYFVTSWDDEAHAAAVNEIKEMCVQNYNHPSICFWGLSNEILMSGNDNPKLMDCHQDLENAVKSIDTKRLTVIAHEYATGWEHPLHEVSDVEGWNHYYGWYRGTMDDLGKWADEYHEKYPDRLISISEYGCDGIISYHSDTPEKMDYTEEYQARIHENACETFASRPWIWGTFVWNMFDFGSSFRREGGTRGRNNKGLVTMDRKIKKDSYYVYKAWFDKNPFVYVAGRRYFNRPGQTTEVRIYSNQREVELWVDGKLWDCKYGEHVFIFKDVPLSKEGTVLTARAGECEDTIWLSSVEKMPEQYVFPGFQRSQDAKNWFNSVEEVAGTLESKDGFYSVHDKMSEIAANELTKRIFMDCLIAATERILGEERILGRNLDLTVAEMLSTGMMPSFLRGKQEMVLRRMHAALLQVKKDKV